MKNRFLISGMSILLMSGTIAGTTLSASAATVNSTNRIPRYVMRSDKLNAEAQVLGLSQTELVSELKSTPMKQIITNHGFTKESFHQKVRAELLIELQNQGYGTSRLNSQKNHHKKHHYNQ
jgi:hypothetical protein